MRLSSSSIRCVTPALLLVGMAAITPPAESASNHRSNLGIGLTILPACPGQAVAPATTTTVAPATSAGGEAAPACGARLERQPRDNALPAPPPAPGVARPPDILLIEF